MGIVLATVSVDPGACALIGPRTARNDAERCHDDPIAALSLNSQYAPRPGDHVTRRDLLRTMAGANQRNAESYILDAIISEQRLCAVRPGSLGRGREAPLWPKASIVSASRVEAAWSNLRPGQRPSSLPYRASPRPQAEASRGQRLSFPACRASSRSRQIARRTRPQAGSALLQLVEPGRHVGKLGSGRSRRGGLLLQFIQPRRNIGKPGGGTFVDAVGELIQTRSVLVLDLVQPRRRLCERCAEVVQLGAFLLPFLCAGDRFQRCFEGANGCGEACGRLGLRAGERRVLQRPVDDKRAASR